jgi:hypothetical protein
MRACTLALCFLSCVFPRVGATVPGSARATCGVHISRQTLLETLTSTIPMSDGSQLAPTDPNAHRILVILVANMRSMGIDMECLAETCDFYPVDGKIASSSCARVFVAAILGNFLNNDLDPEDALARVRVDVATGLLRREYTPQTSRIMFVDFLLVLAVIMLAKRTVDAQEIMA